jgi:7,8-dihydroneopterin aldolase/epimerase/oxygenase
VAPAGMQPDGDLIQLHGLRVVGTHGVLPEEKSRAQPFEADLDLSVDLAPAAIISGPPSYELLEALAGAVARATLDADRRVASVTVSLRKLQPPLAVDIATVGVTITRHR